MLRVFLLFITVSSFCFAQSLPEGISRRIGNELDSTEAEYFGLFSWVKGFKKGMVSSQNGELMFTITRSSAGDTAFILSKESAGNLEKYITLYEDIFADPTAQKSIDWTIISAFLRPSNPIREASEVLLELSDKTILKRPLIWLNDSLMVVWKDNSPISLAELGGKIEIIPFYNINYINNDAIWGNHKAYINHIAKLKEHSLFTKMSPEIVKFLMIKGNSRTENTRKELAIYSDVQEEYLKNFTISLLYKFTMYTDPNRVFLNDEGIYSEMITTKINWGGELLYNINSMFSIGVEYSEIAYLDYARKSDFLNLFSRDVLFGNEASLLARIRLSPRDPINDNFESEISLSIGRGNYMTSSERYAQNIFIGKSEKKATPWIFSIQVGYSYFFTKFVSAYGGMLFRSSTSFEIPDANNFKNTRSVRLIQANSFISLRIHPW